MQVYAPKMYIRQHFAHGHIHKLCYSRYRTQNVEVIVSAKRSLHISRLCFMNIVQWFAWIGRFNFVVVLVFFCCCCFLFVCWISVHCLLFKCFLCSSSFCYYRYYNDAKSQNDAVKFENLTNAQTVQMQVHKHTHTYFLFIHSKCKIYGDLVIHISVGIFTTSPQKNITQKRNFGIEIDRG